LRLVFDIETNGLLDATVVHCVVIADLDNDQVDEYGPDQIAAALDHLKRADYLTGHNIQGFDLPLLRRLHGWAPAADCVIDTLISARLILPNLDDLDDKTAAMGGKALGKLRGRYSLEAFGERLGIPKTGTGIEDWSQWTPEMQQRCVGDTLICRALWHFLQPDGYSQDALALEHRVASICDELTATGVPFDLAAAEQLRQQWTARRAELEAQLAQQFPGTNLNSRPQLGHLLEARGWVSERRTEKTGQPKIDDEVLDALPALYPEFAGIAEHYTLGRRLGQLANGKKAWTKNVGADGCIHGGIIHIGTPHSRAAHLDPNLAQVPSSKRGKPFAAECRALFRARDDWVFVAADQAGLQDRGFAHYLAAFDGGAYAATFANAGAGDTHWQSAINLGLVPASTVRNKQSKVHEVVREGAKRFRYAFLYGAGLELAGRIISDIARAAHQIDAGNDLQQRFFGGSAHPNEVALKRIGKQALNKFEAGTRGLKRLRQNLQARARQHQWLPGLDGRRVPVRALHSALNFIVTSSEAIICKRWLVNVHDELCARFRYGWDGDGVLVLWVHDELVACCRPGIAAEVGAIMVRHAIEPAEFYGRKTPLAAEFKIGASWSTEASIDAVSPEPEPAIDATPPEPEPHEHEPHEHEPEREREQAAPRHSGNGRDDDDDGYTFGTKPHGAAIERYIYKDAAGAPFMRVTRTSSKTFPTDHWQNGRWVSGWPTTVVPYRLPELLAAPATAPVWFTEGEKDTENLAALGLIATTNPGGAKKWRPELAEYFKEKSIVYILEDNDEPGRAHTAKINAALTGIVPNIAIISFPELTEGGDVSDWLTLGGNKKLLLARAEQALKQSSERRAYLTTDLSSVRPRAIRWLWHKHLARGALELLAGAPTVGKSQIQCQYVACATTGRAWPNGAPGIVPCRVIPRQHATRRSLSG
jgi:DNA polymerase I-like protein with 3'-5' exonuclease and polymerase domains